MISASSDSGFTYTHDFVRAIDDYTVPLTFISSATANGNDPITGDAITGYKWWTFAYPTSVDSGANAVGDFVAATNGTASFGGTAAPIVPWGVSYAIWGDPSNTTGWSAARSILLPTPLPVGTVASAPVTASGGESFTITATNGASAVTVDAQYGERLGHTGVPGGPDRGRGDGEPHRHHHLRGSVELQHGNGGGRQGRGVGRAAGRWHGQGLRDHLLHRNYACRRYSARVMIR